MSSRKRHDGDRENRRNTLCIRICGLSCYTTERHLRDVFSNYGHISYVKLMIDEVTGRSRRIAYITYKHEHDAAYAKERTNCLELNGKQMRVDFALNKCFHPQTLRSRFKSKVGKCPSRSRSRPGLSRRRSRSYQSRSRSRSYQRRRNSRVRSRSPMSFQESAMLAISRNRHVGDCTYPGILKFIVIRNLSWSTTERDLRDVFTKYGHIVNVEVTIDQKTCRSRSYAFITYEHEYEAADAIAKTNDLEFDGRRLRVDFTFVKRPDEPTTGQYFGSKPTQREDEPISWCASYCGGFGGFGVSYGGRRSPMPYRSLSPCRCSRHSPSLYRRRRR